ncbi:hypothetical protein GCM10028798_08260 [Humibacter antri]
MRDAPVPLARDAPVVRDAPVPLARDAPVVLPARETRGAVAVIPSFRSSLYR